MSNEEKKANNPETEDITENKWEKKLKNKNGSVMENVESVRNQVDIIDSKVAEDEKFLKLNGGIQNNPEVGQRVSNMMIDSIKAKLSLISLSKECEQAKKQKIAEKEKERQRKKEEKGATQKLDPNLSQGIPAYNNQGNYSSASKKNLGYLNQPDNSLNMNSLSNNQYSNDNQMDISNSNPLKCSKKGKKSKKSASKKALQKSGISQQENQGYNQYNDNMMGYDMGQADYGMAQERDDDEI